ncbi:GPI biosynthesis protein family Pig-F-domain-containing protein [Gorgonomyces haynaldii]|nr:GPI biosynthesis protein family Pig-F-domain-containing protein [Gorgonomyces haynaldii]
MPSLESREQTIPIYLLLSTTILFVMRYLFGLLDLLEKSPRLLSILYLSLMLYCGFILFGAPVLIWHEQTLLLAMFVSVLVLTGTRSDLQSIMHPNTTQDKHTRLDLVLTLLGCWLSCFILPLDWQKEYQKWPIPLVYGAFWGHTLAQILNLLSNYSVE